MRRVDRRARTTLKIFAILAVVALLAMQVSADFFPGWELIWKYVVLNLIKHLAEWAANTVGYVMSPGIVLMQINPCVYSSTSACPPYNIVIFQEETLTFAMLQDPRIRDINIKFMQMLQVWYIFAIVVVGAYLIFMAGSPQGRSNAKDTFVRLIVGMVLVSQSPVIFQMMLDIERYIADRLMATAVLGFGPAQRNVLFFTNAKYCCTMYILIFVSSIAAILGAVRYFLVYVMACFFPLTLFMYFTDIPNPFFSLRGLGTRLWRFTITLLIIQILQVLMLATGLIIASSGASPNLLDFLLMTTAFGGILLTPMIGMQLMAWVGSAVHLASTRPSTTLSRFIATWMRTGNIATSLETASGQYMIGHSMGDHVGGEATGPSTGFKLGIPNAPFFSAYSADEMEFPQRGPVAPAGFIPGARNFGPGLMATTGSAAGRSIMAGAAGVTGTSGGRRTTGGFTGGAGHMPSSGAGANVRAAGRGGVGGGRGGAKRVTSRSTMPGGSRATQLPGTSAGAPGDGLAGGGKGGPKAAGEAVSASESAGSTQHAGGTAYTRRTPSDAAATPGATHVTPGEATPGKAEVEVLPPKPDEFTAEPLNPPLMKSEIAEGGGFGQKGPSVKPRTTITPTSYKQPTGTAGLPIGNQIDRQREAGTPTAAAMRPAMSDVDKAAEARKAKEFNDGMAEHQKSLAESREAWREWERKRERASREADRDAADYARREEEKAKRFALGEERKARDYAVRYLRKHGYSESQGGGIVDAAGGADNPVLADPKLGLAAMVDSVERAGGRRKSGGRGEMSGDEKAGLMSRYVDNSRRYQNLGAYGSTRGAEGRGEGRPTAVGKANAGRFRDFIDGKLDPAGEGKAPEDPVEALDNIMKTQDEHWSTADRLMDDAVFGNLTPDQHLRKQAEAEERRPYRRRAARAAAAEAAEPRRRPAPSHTPEEVARDERAIHERLKKEELRDKAELDAKDREWKSMEALEKEARMEATRAEEGEMPETGATIKKKKKPRTEEDEEEGDTA